MDTGRECLISPEVAILDEVSRSMKDAELPFGVGIDFMHNEADIHGVLYFTAKKASTSSMEWVRR